MDTQHTSVRPHPQSPNGGKNHPQRRTWGGVIHDNVRHTTRFTVIGNHLAQHAELSLLAIGLAVHIQSLPSGAAIDIRSLAARFPEGKARIATALRELEAHGYLRRTCERTSSGRIVTRTVSCNQPGRTGDDTEKEPAKPKRPAPRADKPPRRALPAVPQPVYPAPDLLLTALDVLAGLHREDPRLRLSATDADHLAPGVVAWLERQMPPSAVRQALTSDLPPDRLHRPAALLAHRLTAQLPPLPPFRATDGTPTVPHPLQNCDVCDRAFRAATPGRCSGCITTTEEIHGQPTP